MIDYCKSGAMSDKLASCQNTRSCLTPNRQKSVNLYKKVVNAHIMRFHGNVDISSQGKAAIKPINCK